MEKMDYAELATILEVTKIILISYLTAKAIIGFRKAMEPDYILGFLSTFAETLKEWQTLLLTPIILCEYCMSSVWTILISLVFGQTNPIHIGIGILVTCGIVVYLQHERN
jgi:hypothetical protein